MLKKSILLLSLSILLGTAPLAGMRLPKQRQSTGNSLETALACFFVTALTYQYQLDTIKNASSNGATNSGTTMSTSSSSGEVSSARANHAEIFVDPIIIQIRTSAQALENAQRRAEAQSSSSSSSSSSSTRASQESIENADRAEITEIIRILLTDFFQRVDNSQFRQQFSEQDFDRVVEDAVAQVRQFRNGGWSGRIGELIFATTKTNSGPAIVIMRLG